MHAVVHFMNFIKSCRYTVAYYSINVFFCVIYKVQFAWLLTEISPIRFIVTLLVNIFLKALVSCQLLTGTTEVT